MTKQLLITLMIAALCGFANGRQAGAAGEVEMNRIVATAKEKPANTAKAKTKAPAKPAAKRVAGDRPPNFVVIFVDDLGYADIQPFSDRYATPNLARMAEEGRTFSSFYTANSVCTPSRAGLMTGCYPARVDMLHNDLEIPAA